MDTSSGGAGRAGELVERVLSVVEQIPSGRVLSYGDVAALAPAPTPRAVGQVLGRHGRQVPWWRVLRADGTPVPHLRDEQLALLRAESTPMTPSGASVDLRRARWAAAVSEPDGSEPDGSEPDGSEPDPQPSLFD